MIKKIVTFIVMVPVMTIVLYILTVGTGGAIVGSRASVENNATSFEDGYDTGYEAGAEFGANYGGLLFLVSLALSTAGSGFLVFAGILPWCKNKYAQGG